MSVRIPETIPEFNSYINSTDDYIAAGTPTTNGARLGLTSTNISDWHDKRVEWRDTLFPLYSNANTSTSVVKADVHDFIHDFRAFGNPLLNIMATSPNAGNADEGAFHFKIGHADPTHSTTPLTAVVLFEAKRLGGGDVQFICTVSTDETRASKPEGSDSVQVSYMIQDGSSGSPGPGPDPGPPGADDPKMTREIFTKAHFTKHYGSNAISKVVVIYMRWYNTKHPELAGPWSDLKAIVIA